MIKLFPFIMAASLTLSGIEPKSLSSRMEFNDEMNSFFLEELSYPSMNIESEHLEEKPASNVAIEATLLEDGAWQIQFQFLDTLNPVTVKKAINGRAIQLTFSQSIDSKDLLKVQENLGYLIKRFANGYNTLYLVAKKDVSYEVIQNASKDNVILKITPLEGSPAEETWLLKLAEARFLYEVRDYFAAFAAIDKLLLEDPDNEEVLLLLSSLEGVLPRWQMRLQILEYVNREHPYDEDVWELIKDTYTPHTPFIAFDRQIQQTKALSTYQLYGARGEYILESTAANTLYAGMGWQRYRGHITSIVNSQGEFFPFNGTRNQATLLIRNEELDGSTESGFLYAQARAIGLGAEASTLIPWIQGGLVGTVDWHKPYWAVYEALAFQGREDKIYARVNSVYNRYVNGAIGGGFHRVGITGIPNGFQSRLFNFELALNWNFPNPLVSFIYTIDGEYVSSIKTKKDAQGVEFNPVPFTTYEYHTVKVAFAYQLREWWNFALFAGETINRFGINSPTYGISFKYAKPWPCGVELELAAYQIPSATNIGSNTDYITGSFTLRF